MKIPIDGVQAFVHVAELGSFHRAAEHLFITQTALTRRIQRLEAFVGLRLLDRTTRSTTLSPMGKEFLPMARRIIDDLVDGLDLHSPSGVSFEVKIACIRALDKDFLPQAAPAVAQTAGSGRIRPRSRCFLAQGRRFSAQRTDLSSRFRSV
jgi:DNA-binding transcriptional LysR family regulator